MNSRILLPSILFTSLFAMSLNATAQDASIEGTTDTTAQASVPTDELATRYADLVGSTEAATELVQQLRVDSETGATMGYGEIDMTLALAGALVDSGDAADVDAALDTILQLRADGAGWGEIAQELGFNLGELVSAGRRADAAAQADGRAEAGLAIAEEARSGTAGADADASADASVDANAGAATAADAKTRAEVGRATAADAKANARIDRGLRGTTSGRPVGVGAPVRPQVPQRPNRPQRPGGR